MSEQSEQSTEITTVEKTEKVKDPRKVELGKRLAKISREAKERKARQWSEAEAARVEKEAKSDHEMDNQREITDYIDFRYFIGGVGLVAALGGLYYSYKREIREENSSCDSFTEGKSKKKKKTEERVKQVLLMNLKINLKNTFKKCAVQGFETL